MATGRSHPCNFYRKSLLVMIGHSFSEFRPCWVLRSSFCKPGSWGFLVSCGVTERCMKCFRFGKCGGQANVSIIRYMCVYMSLFFCPYIIYLYIYTLLLYINIFVLVYIYIHVIQRSSWNTLHRWFAKWTLCFSIALLVYQAADPRVQEVSCDASRSVSRMPPHAIGFDTLLLV